MDISHSVLWIIVAVLGGIIEVMTLGLTTIWFSVGALVALLFSMLELPLGIQITVFVVTSSLLLYYTRPIAKKVLKIGHTKTNVDSLEGEVGVVIKEINKFKSTGQVKINGQIWSAKTLHDEVISENEKVEVINVEGVKLVVRKVIN